MPTNLCLVAINNTTFKVDEIEGAGATALPDLWGYNDAMPEGPSPSTTTGEFEVLGTTFTATGERGQYSTESAIPAYVEPPTPTDTLYKRREGGDFYIVDEEGRIVTGPTGSDNTFALFRQSNDQVKCILITWDDVERIGWGSIELINPSEINPASGSGGEILGHVFTNTAAGVYNVSPEINLDFPG